MRSPLLSPSRRSGAGPLLLGLSFLTLLSCAPARPPEAPAYREPGDGTLLPVFALEPGGRLDHWGVVPLGPGPYTALEVQMVRTGDRSVPRVLLFRTSGEVDQYVRPGEGALLGNLAGDPWNPGPPAEGIRTLGSRRGPRGWSCTLELEDRNGRRIALAVREDRPVAGGRTVLGAVGLGGGPPRAFPLVVQEDVWYSAPENLSLELTVDGRRQAPPDPGLVPDLLRQVRSGGRAVWAGWNPRRTGILVPAAAGPGAGLRDGHPELSRLDLPGGGLGLRFVPPFPDVGRLGAGALVRGRILGEGPGDPDLWAARYEVEVRAGTAEVRIFPERAWQPFAGNPWVATFGWTGTLTRTPGGWAWESGWTRENGWLPGRVPGPLP